MMDNQKTAADWYATMRESNERNFKAFFEIGGDNDLLHSENRRCDTEIIQQAMDSAAKAEREKIACYIRNLDEYGFKYLAYNILCLDTASEKAHNFTEQGDNKQ